MCITTTGTSYSAAMPAILSSDFKPLMSFIIEAPASNASRATSDLYVSMDIGICTSFASSFMTGITLFNSSSSERGSAPGRVDSPPISMISEPSAAKFIP